MPQAVLDPYTRVLASVADGNSFDLCFVSVRVAAAERPVHQHVATRIAGLSCWDPCSISVVLTSEMVTLCISVVTKARRDFPTSTRGRLIVFGIFGCGVCTAGLMFALTSPVWAPLAVFSSLAYVGVYSVQVLSAATKKCCNRISNWGAAQFKSLLHPQPPAPTARSSSIKMQQRAAAIEDMGFLRVIFEGLPGVDTEGALQKIDAWKQRTEESVVGSDSEHDVKLLTLS